MSEDEIILTHILQCRAIDLAVDGLALTPSQEEQFRRYKCRRLAGEPLQYILGCCDFMGLELGVNPTVLVPRPETEQLVDTALKYFKGGAALDLGTGSGNIAVALAKFVEHCEVIAMDKSAQALDTARANAKRHGVMQRMTFIHGDMSNEKFILNLLKDAKFDLVISNPPYIPTEQLSTLPQDVRKEPPAALDGGRDGLKFIRIIIKYTPCLLRKGACLMMEFGDGQAEAVKQLAQDTRLFSTIEIFKDLAGRDRVMRAVL
ncbi:MAG: peptide chain release factor N(5)-glutamine methyltransferase [Candidatus Omnitrophica bacterium]|nr:peptide chain release factor N(5)-glutamine methyltransferase [Candidatus Omnitrophota bacterium]MDE2009074.1 peptide chain release factor N(5)-glutamine methyltransferase [Candidatus Omnitrophota bacterium]MDE2214261.1 peptide chain release factor N(5)-glutamine methyltransferase [Candidatus Omnitrophota bacterium]MDE2231298.1 peptide chain release factor N(5)-glutamine methyltransferase [Candidatus Omnitrophota bacterium]